jgi:cyanate permease
MSRRPVTRGGRQKSKRWKTYLWIAAFSLVVIGLIYYEQTAVLYILATLGLAGLLIIVGMANLKNRVADDPVPGDDAAAIGSGIAATLPETAPRPPQPTRRRR